MSKRILTLVVAAAFIFALVGVSTAKAATIEELQALIAQLQAQIAALSGGSSTAAGEITKDLTIGSRGDQVEILQKYLEDEGYLVMPAGVAYGYFGALTKSAVAKWQADNGVTPAAGYFGPKSRAMYATLNPVTPVGDDDDDADDVADLDGGAGSISDVDYISKLSNEEVGEGDSDVEVAGLTLEADNGSDIELVAVNLNFTQGNANRDFEKYADEVSVWFEGEEIARLDADEFTDDDLFDKTVTLDRGAIIRAGETGDLVVAVSGVSNLDSTDEGETWTLEFESVRFRDGLGAVITDSSTGDINDGAGRTFSFEGFATAANLELKVTRGSAAINDTRIIMVHDTQDTDNVEILSFKIEAEGNSDLDIDDMSVDFTSVGAGVGEIINTAKLVVDGDVIGSESVASSTATTTTVTFDNIDLTVEAGDTIEVIVEVDINDIDGAFSAGDTLMADVNPDDTAWDVEDEEGNDVVAADKTGAASSEYHAFYSTGIVIAPVSTSETKDDTNGDTAGGNRGLYTIKFNVTAFEDDMYLPTGATIATSTVDPDDAIAYVVEDSNGTALMLNDAGLASTTAVVSSDASTSGDYYVVYQGETKSFTLQVTLVPTVDGYYRAQLYGVNYNVDTADIADTLQLASPAADFETDYVNLDV